MGNRTHLTIAEKNEVRRFHASRSGVQQSELLDWVRARFGKSVGRSTLSAIVREPIETHITDTRVKKRPPLHPEVDVALLAFASANGSRVAISDEVLLAQARRTANVSPSWIQRFKKRHGLGLRGGTAAATASVSTSSGDSGGVGAHDAGGVDISSPPLQQERLSAANELTGDHLATQAESPMHPTATTSATSVDAAIDADNRNVSDLMRRQAIDIKTKQQVIAWIAGEGGGVASRAAQHFRALGWSLDPGVCRRWWRQKDEILATDGRKKRLRRRSSTRPVSGGLPAAQYKPAGMQSGVSAPDIHALNARGVRVALAPSPPSQQSQQSQPTRAMPFSDLRARHQQQQQQHTPSRRPRMNQYIDHTLLKADALPSQVRVLCEEAAEHQFASVCVNASYAAFAREVLDELSSSDTSHRVKVCCVVGFPLGATTPAVKAFEAAQCLEDGAEEIDMVLNVGRLVAGEYDYVLRDICAVVAECKRRRAVSKVILETALLTPEQVAKASELAVAAGADFIKTSTGFSTRGASEDDVKIMAPIAARAGKQVKASGGIRSADDARRMIALGATRLGTSAGVKIVQGEASDAAY